MSQFLKPNLTLRDFQQQAIDFALKLKKCIIALPTGTGKTITSLTAYAKFREQNPHVNKLIYITEKPLVLQTTEQDLPTYFNFKYDYIYNHTKKQRKQVYTRFIAELDILVINYATLRVDFEDFGQIYQHLNANIAVIFDEATAFKSPKSQITNCVKLLTKVSKFALAMTATPSTSGLFDIFNIMCCLGISPYSRSQFDSLHCVNDSMKMFTLRYNDQVRTFTGHLDAKNTVLKEQGRPYNYTAYFNLSKSFKLPTNIHFVHTPKQGILKIFNQNAGTFSWTIGSHMYFKTQLLLTAGSHRVSISVNVYDSAKQVGYKNLPLFRKSTEHLMFVRAKNEIAKELPPISVQYRYTEMDDKTRQTLAKMVNNGELAPSQMEIATITPQAYNTSLDIDYQTPKVANLISFLQNDIPEDKCIVFFPYTRSTQILRRILAKELNTDVAYATGEDDTDNNEEVKRFLSSPHTRILLGTGSLLKGLNLQSVNYIACLQKPYTFGNYQQLVGRINRIGGDYSPKTIVNFVVKDSRDDDVKTAVLEQAVLTYNLNPKLVEEGLIPPNMLQRKGMTEQEAKRYLDNQFEVRKLDFIKKV